MNMARWMCGKRLWDKVPSDELRDRLGIASFRSNKGTDRYGSGVYDDWVQKCMEYPRLNGRNCKGRPKMIRSEVVNKNLEELGMCEVDVQNRVRSKHVLLEACWDHAHLRISGTGSPTHSWKSAVKCLVIPTCRQACWRYIVFTVCLFVRKFFVTDITGTG